MEDKGLGIEPDDIEGLADFDTDDATPRGAGTASSTYQTQAIRNLQRARKSLTSEGDATGLTDHLMQAAQIWAILELADAVRSGRQL